MSTSDQRASTLKKYIKNKARELKTSSPELKKTQLYNLIARRAFGADSYRHLLNAARLYGPECIYGDHMSRIDCGSFWEVVPKEHLPSMLGINDGTFTRLVEFFDGSPDAYGDGSYDQVAVRPMLIQPRGEHKLLRQPSYLYFPQDANGIANGFPEPQTEGYLIGAEDWGMNKVEEFYRVNVDLDEDAEGKLVIMDNAAFEKKWFSRSFHFDNYEFSLWQQVHSINSVEVSDRNTEAMITQARHTEQHL